MTTKTLQVSETYSKEDVRVIKNLIDPSGKLEDEQLHLFLHVCKEKRLDPRTKQIYAIPRFNSRSGKMELTIQTSIDGFRLIAERTGKYAPGKPTVFHFNDTHQLTGATVFVKKYTDDGTWHEVSATAFLHEYRPSGKNTFWDKMPSVMIEKVGESRALRRAFPGDFSGIYSEDEMAQAKNNHAQEPVAEAPKPKVTKATITDDQARELDEIIGSDVKYRRDVLNFLKKSEGLDSFSGMSVEIFDRAMKVAKAKLAERSHEDTLVAGV